MATSVKKNAANSSNPPLIVNKITVTSVNRETLDIGKLKRIIKRAESDTSQNRTGLYDMYTNICFDEHVTSETQKLVMAVTNSEIIFVNEKNEEVPELMDVIDTTEFEETLEEIVYSKLWGITLAQFKPGVKIFEPTFIDRKNIRPIQGVVAYDQNTDEGESYRVPPYQYWMLEVGKPKDLGLLMKAAFWVIIKRGGISDWAELCEIFGMPIRVGEYDAFDEATRMELEKALSEMGSASYIMKPKGSEVNLIESKSTSPGDLHESLVNICNKAISILFLGQTLTTLDKSGSGQAQGTVHADTKEEIVKAYKRFVRRVLNRKLIPILENLGYPVKGGKFIFRDQVAVAERLNKMKLLEMVKKLGAPIEDDDIYEQSGVPKPKNYDALKAEMKANKPDFNEDEPDDEEPEEKPKKKPTGTKKQLNWWLKFRSELADFFRPSPETLSSEGLHESILSFYSFGCCAPGTVKLAVSEEWDSIFEDFAQHVYDEKGTIHMPSYFKTAQRLTEAIMNGIGGGYDFDNPANSLAAALRGNVFQFSGAKNLFEQKMMAGLITDENGEKLPFKDFLSKVKSINEDYNKRFLEAEYDNAVGSATMALKWKNFESIGTEWLKYSTVGDDRVRDEHRKLDGIILPFNSPVWNRIYPPNDWGCRCAVVPSDKPKNPISEADAGRLGKEAVNKSVFENNVGKTEMIYTDGHPYFKTTKGIRELDAEKNYGMPSIGTIMRKSEDFPTPVQIDDYNKWWADMVKKNGVNKSDFVLTDSIGNKVVFTSSPDGKNKQDFFKDHITRKKDGREKYAANVVDVFTAPSEQWMKGTKGKQEMQYLKYYNDGAYLLTVVRDGNELKAQTFYKIDKAKYSDGEIRKKRTGVLLAKK